MLTDRLIRGMENVALVGTRLPPGALMRASDVASSDRSLRRRVYREGMLLVFWTGLVFIAGFGLIGIPALFGAIVPSSSSTGFAIAGLVGAFCMAGLLIHLLRYVVLVCVGLIGTSELIGASRQFFRIRRKADETLPEPRWFVWLTSATDVDLLVQAAAVAVLIGASLVGSHGAGN